MQDEKCSFNYAFLIWSDAPHWNPECRAKHSGCCIAIINPLDHLMKSFAKGSNSVKWSQYTTLKINNKTPNKGFSSLLIFPSLQKQCSCISNRFWFFSLKNKSIIYFLNPKSENVRIWMLGVLEAYGVTDCKIFSLSFQRWSSMSLLGCPQCSSNLKGWSSNAIANNNNNVHLSCAHQCPERSHDTY